MEKFKMSGLDYIKSNERIAPKDLIKFFAAAKKELEEENKIENEEAIYILELMAEYITEDYKGGELIYRSRAIGR